ncbi:hypothetical protein Pla110_27250 [Polystyrenella longa]|uniref:Uncharacterized protein n=1 Tax=Polystyrenella longa TaxID=2528007 RepID=A0A518CP44_9PLAN|nr:hypothetical protein Pla110_27250 [Polystyrenella longa]
MGEVMDFSKQETDDPGDFLRTVKIRLEGVRKEYSHKWIKGNIMGVPLTSDSSLERVPAWSL